MDYLNYAKAFNAREEVTTWIKTTLKNYLAKETLKIGDKTYNKKEAD